MALISASILNIDFGNLEAGIKSIEDAGIDSFHMDIMDGVFVDNISFGPEIVSRVREITKLPIITHLMIVNPEKFVDKFFEVGSDSIIVHVESLNESNRHILDKNNMGITVNPDIELDKLYQNLEKVDRVLLMSVMAGFGGQEFIRSTIERISDVRRKRDELGLDFIISVDGGINGDNAGECVSAGADEIAVGSYITKAEDPEQRIKQLQTLRCR